MNKNDSNVYYLTPSEEILLRMELHLAAMLKELELLRAEHPSLTERIDEEAE
jgi:hypothetical protein